eukprot:6955213-Pyramimonas_sp.AAC.1
MTARKNVTEWGEEEGRLIGAHMERALAIEQKLHLPERGPAPEALVSGAASMGAFTEMLREAVYTPRENHSQEGRRYIPRVITNRYLGRTASCCPFTTHPHEGRRCTPSVRTNRRRGGGVHPA